MAKSTWQCCHHDGALTSLALIFVLIVGVTVGIYIMVALFQGITGGPLTPTQVSAIIVVACTALIVLLIIYYTPLGRRRAKNKRDD